MNVKANPFNSFAFVSMAALAISGGSLVACQLQPAMQEQEVPPSQHRQQHPKAH